MQEQQRSRLTSYIGMALIFVLTFVWMRYVMPSQKQSEQAATNSTEAPAGQPSQTPAAAPVVTTPTDTAQMQQNAGKFGAFATAAVGTEQIIVLENPLTRVEFSTKGGRIRLINTKNYQKLNIDSTGEDVKSPLYLLEDLKNRFGYSLDVAGANGKVFTQDLYFQATKEGDNTVVFRAPAANGGYFEQRYTLAPDSYELDYKVAFNNLQGVLTTNQIQLEWDNYLDKIEKNQSYERTMSSVYFKAGDAGTDYCDCRKDDQESLGDQPVKWFSHANQFLIPLWWLKTFLFAIL